MSASLRARAIGYFVEPAAPARGTGRVPAPPPSTDPRTIGQVPAPRVAELQTLQPAAPPRAGNLQTLHPVPRTARVSHAGATQMPLRAAVLGGPKDAPPVAGALACALRAAARTSAAAVAVWAPASGSGVSSHHGPHAAAAPPPSSLGMPPRRGPATLAASRLAARLSARGLAAAGRGRLAWVALEDHPVAAAVAARRVAGALEVPFVTVLAGPRCEAVEGLLAEQDLVLVVAEAPEGPLARLAVETCTAAALACAPCGAGVARWLALEGLAGTRLLSTPARGLVRDLAEPPVLPLEEVAW